jgi:hypothetical protein
MDAICEETSVEQDFGTLNNLATELILRLGEIKETS